VNERRLTVWPQCDGSRPVCSNCARSRRYRCHGFVADPPRDSREHEGGAESNEDLEGVHSEVRQSHTPNTTAHGDVVPVAETQDANCIAEMTGMFSEYIPLDGDELDWSMVNLPSLDLEDL